jgi:hypothetical protein
MQKEQEHQPETLPGRDGFVHSSATGRIGPVNSLTRIEAAPRIFTASGECNTAII